MHRHCLHAAALMLVHLGACGGSTTDNLTIDAPASGDARVFDGASASVLDARAVDASAGAVDARAFDAPTGGVTFDAPPANPTFDAPPATPTFDAPPGGGTFDAPVVVTFDAPPVNPTFDAPVVVTFDAPPPPPEITAMRVNTLSILDPHPVASNCGDLAATLNTLIIAPALNDRSLNLLVLFAPLDEGDGVTSPAEVVLADCSSATTCTAGAGNTRFESNVRSETTDACLAALPGTLTPDDGPYDGSAVPAVTPGGGHACFVSDEENLTLSFSGITISLSAARVGARYGNGTLTNGLVRGFISEAAAEQVTVPIFGNLAAILWGGAGNSCMPGVGDKDLGPDGVTSGWYLYLAFTAEEVSYTEL